jgi:hypothetical protein
MELPSTIKRLQDAQIDGVSAMKRLCKLLFGVELPAAIIALPSDRFSPSPNETVAQAKARHFNNVYGERIKQRIVVRIAIALWLSIPVSLVSGWLFVAGNDTGSGMVSWAQQKRAEWDAAGAGEIRALDDQVRAARQEQYDLMFKKTRLEAELKRIGG